MIWLRPFWIALQFLTRLPVRLESPPDRHSLGISLLYYPVVGLVIGLILSALASGLSAIGGWLPAVLVLMVWVSVTGALHLDGLADSTDAWVGGMNDPERTLAIMKDPRSGPMAVTMVVMVLLLKAAALERLIVQHDWLALTLAPILGRTTPLLLFLTTPYVRPQGLGSELARELPHPSCQWVLVLVAGATLGASGIPGIGLLLITVTLFWRLRRSMVRRLGGATGDTTGALVELTECVVLIYSALANNFIF